MPWFSALIIISQVAKRGCVFCAATPHLSVRSRNSAGYCCALHAMPSLHLLCAWFSKCTTLPCHPIEPLALTSLFIQELQSSCQESHCRKFIAAETGSRFTLLQPLVNPTMGQIHSNSVGTGQYNSPHNSPVPAPRALVDLLFE